MGPTGVRFTTISTPITTFELWVYSDGTTWFLAKGWDEFEAGQQRAALGSNVGRKADVVRHPLG